MKDNQQMTVKQREGFEITLREALNEAKKILSAKTDEAQTAALQQILEETGAVELVAHIRELNSHLEQSTTKLEALGFEIRHDGDVELIYQPPEGLKETFEALVAKQVVVETERVNSLYQALGNMWAVTTVPEAKQVIEAVAR